jgi:hypothetical protein
MEKVLKLFLKLAACCCSKISFEVSDLGTGALNSLFGSFFGRHLLMERTNTELNTCHDNGVTNVDWEGNI